MGCGCKQKHGAKMAPTHKLTTKKTVTMAPMPVPKALQSLIPMSNRTASYSMLMKPGESVEVQAPLYEYLESNFDVYFLKSTMGATKNAT